MKTLKQLVGRSGAVDCRRAARYIDEVAGQLSALHAASQLHRAVRPSAIEIDSLGRAVLAPEPKQAFENSSGATVDEVDQEFIDEVVDYLPPELAMSNQRVKPATDLYGLGGTLYFLLLARPPFPLGTVSERLLKHQLELPEPPSRLRLDVPQALSDLCMQMLAKRACDRPQAAETVRQRLFPYLF